MMPAGFFTISLDFELYWGVREVWSRRQYGHRILGYRTAIPAMLELFHRYGVHATWAVVGFTTFADKRTLLEYLPDEHPDYLDSTLDPYRHLNQVGENEAVDPYHFGYSLIRQILDTPGMELASHTFSHFFCLDSRRNAGAFRADLEASLRAHQRLGSRPTSLIFPRNQYDGPHLREAAEAGFKVYRGNEAHQWYQPRCRDEQRPRIRLGRFLDAYINLCGDHLSGVSIDQAGLVNVPSSRFLRPYQKSLRLLEPIRLGRLLNSMNHAAEVGSGFHLWWHPHNFGADLKENLAFLEQVLRHYRLLRDRTGMVSLGMAEAAVFSGVVSAR